MVKSYLNPTGLIRHYSLMMLFAVSFLTSSSHIIGQDALACNDNVQVSLNFNCEADITPGMILEGEDESQLFNYTVTIQGVTGTIVTAPGNYGVTVTDNTSGNYCWGNITVEDKIAPEITTCPCPPGNTDPDCQFLCSDQEAIENGDIILPAPVVIENCGTFTSEFSDLLTGDDCGGFILRRSYLFTDESGNEATGCVQEFLLSPIDLDDVTMPVSPLEMPCGSDANPADVFEHFSPLVGEDIAVTYAYPTINGIAIEEAFCNLIVAIDDVVIPVCDQSCSNSFKTLRSWTVIDWCNSESRDFTQIIKSVDTTPPTIVANDITVSTDPWVCEANFYLPYPQILHDDCTPFVDYTVTGPAGVTIVYDDTNDLYLASGAPKGNHTFVYTASDCCDNTADEPIMVTVVDQTAPVPIAKQNIVVSLTQAANGNGTAKMYANSVDNGSHDGCTDVKLEIRRDTDICNINGNTTYNNDGHPNDSNTDSDDGAFVKFCCEDLDNAVVDIDGDGENDPGYVMVWLRVFDDGDMNGVFGSAGDNYNETWCYVKVEDKLNPVLNCPPDVTIECDDDVNDLSLVGEAEGAFTCGPAEVEYNDIIENLDNCGVGFVRRRWNIVGTPSVFCDQNIYKVAGNPFDGNITWPADFETDCTDLENDVVPTWNDVPCASVGYTLDSDTFYFEEDACFKILNEWTVIDWCQYDPNDNNPTGIWSDIQEIKVMDDVSPEMSCEDIYIDINDHDDSDNDGVTCEAKNITLTKVANDNGDCASQWLKWIIQIDINADGSFDYEYSSLLPTNDNSFNDTNGNGIPDRYIAPTNSGDSVEVVLPIDIQGSMSAHKVSWKVTDGCGNITSCLDDLYIQDNKAPTPYCFDISTALMENGSVQLWACDFDLGSFDNCTEHENLRFTFTPVAPELDPLFDEDTRCSSRTFDCDDLLNNPVPLEMYVWDEKGNVDYCSIELTLIDNQGGCDDTGGRISGKITTTNGNLISGIPVKLSSPIVDIEKEYISNEAGEFTFFNNPLNAPYLVMPEFTQSNSRDGVNTLDLVYIQRHILELQSFDDPYHIAASDINNDHQVTTSDLLHLRKLILGIYDEFPENSSYKFINASNPIESENIFPIEEGIEISTLTEDIENQDFIAIKIGDVNNDASYGLQNISSDTRSDEEIIFNYETIEQNGQTILNFYTDNKEKLSGFQLAIATDDIHHAQTIAGQIDIQNSTHITQEEMRIVYANGAPISIDPDQPLFSVVTSARQLDNITLSNKFLHNEYYDENLITHQIVVKKVTNDKVNYFEVSQNTPNPFKEETKITVNLPYDDVVTLEINDINGKTILNKEVHGIHGQNDIIINNEDITSPGVYFYSIKCAGQHITKKMIVID